MPKNLFAQFVCNFNEKRLHWSSVVHGFTIFIISKTVGDVQIVLGFSEYLKCFFKRFVTLLCQNNVNVEDGSAMKRSEKNQP